MKIVTAAVSALTRGSAPPARSERFRRVDTRVPTR
jgi:hypothetical protein